MSWKFIAFGDGEQYDVPDDCFLVELSENIRERDCSDVCMSLRNGEKIPGCKIIGEYDKEGNLIEVK